MPNTQRSTNSPFSTDRSCQPSQILCPEAGCGEQDETTVDTIREHFQSKHPNHTEGGHFAALLHDATIDQHWPKEEDSEALYLIKQPETRPISQEQLVAEVNGIYAGLVMVESKCIEVDNAQSSQNDTKLNNEQWQALIALHRTLLNEHHDFLLASQHPSASLALKRLALKYAMPARMWRHGIQSFLELLRNRLPGSQEHMLTFIYMAYSILTLLYETAPAFKDTWMECLGDIGRYRKAIEEEDIEAWASISRHWYSKVSDQVPTTGRLYHHLGILAPPNALQQLYYYAKSLCVPIRFALAEGSIMRLFGQILGEGTRQVPCLDPIDTAIVKTHEILFSRKHPDRFTTALDEFLKPLDAHIGHIADRWKEAGYYIAITNCCTLLSYGREDNIIMKAIRDQNEGKRNEGMTGGIDTLQPSEDFGNAIRLAMGTHEVVFCRSDDANVLPYVHVVMVFMFFLTRIPSAYHQLQDRFPFILLSQMLNRLMADFKDDSRVSSNKFPRESGDLPRPVPEDFALKGLVFADEYFPQDWFADEMEHNERSFEKASMTDARKLRIIWLGHKIALSSVGLTWDDISSRFGVLPEYEKESKQTLEGAGVEDAIDVDEVPLL
ncbi:hypothetical protein F4802DRAFT_591877 [Xylaria palmicola]|nr:hypothetical protein F4802DRAFT_591877 [Xylaria palmicola]